MALTATTLAGAKSATVNVNKITLTSATGAAKKDLALVDAEWMRITDVSLTPTLEVVPGYNGSTAGPHGVLAPVIYGRPSDFVNAGIVPNGVLTSQSFGVDGAITGPSGTGVPTSNTVIYLTKGSAGAYTLAAPAIDQQNTLIFVSTSAYAHTITVAEGFYGNTTSSDVATFAATVNSTLTVKAQNGLWAPISTADDGTLIG
jgi:hypothetical protein